jgi:hypothetical protein
VLLNLILNAMDALEGAGGYRSWTVSTTVRRDATQVVEISLADTDTDTDTGPGIAAVQLDRIFDPFFSTKANCVGMGLSRSLQALAAHDNVVVNLGGLAMRISGRAFHRKPLPPGAEEMAQDLRLYVEVALDAFGPQRCMFEVGPVVDPICRFSGWVGNAANLELTRRTG